MESLFNSNQSSHLLMQSMREAVDQVRRERALSVERLAQKVGMHRNTIGKIERGEMDMGLSTLFRIYTVLGISKVFLNEGKLVLK